MPILDLEKTVNRICDEIRKFPGRCTVGISGGIDSAVVAALCARAKGPDMLNGVFTGLNSSEDSLRRARMVADAVGFKLIELEVTIPFDTIVNETLLAVQTGMGTEKLAEIDHRMNQDPLVLGSFRSCLRAPILRFVNRLFGGGIVYGTGNECEDRWVRFYQKGGDGEVDCNPIASFSKGEVRQLAVFLGIPVEVITCTPTPDLWGVGDQHSDEAELSELSGVPWTYSVVEGETGEYLKVGTIERMSRLLDKETGDRPAGLKCTVESTLFSDWYPVEKAIEEIGPLAKEIGLTEEHLASAKKWEASTRHKMNPNCPSLVDRKGLIAEGCITNQLPKQLLILT